MINFNIKKGNKRFLDNLRAWNEEFFVRKKFEFPNTVYIPDRITSNITFFFVNYLTLICLIVLIGRYLLYEIFIFFKKVYETFQYF